MNIINLINKEKGNIDYHFNRFPDGEVTIQLGELNRRYPVTIICRIRNAEELFIMMQLSDILQRQLVRIDLITIYYLMSMRHDRLFDIGESCTLHLVSKVINSFHANTVQILEPHSMETLFSIDNSEAIQGDHKAFHYSKLLCFPDAGAAERYNDDYDCIYCTKERTSSGINIEIHGGIKDLKGETTILVMDDLIDGGGTFLALAPKLRALNPKSIELSVTHAVNYTGLRGVCEVYDMVYITNSYQDWIGEKKLIVQNLFYDG